MQDDTRDDTMTHREHQLYRRQERERANCWSETAEQREERLRKRRPRDRARHADNSTE